MVWLSVFGLVSFAFQKISLGFWSFVFHWWWDGLFIPAATWRFAVDMRRITADRAIVPILYGASPFHQLRRVQKCRKKSVRAAETARKQAFRTV